MIILDPSTQIWPVDDPEGGQLADAYQHHLHRAIRGSKNTILGKLATAPGNFLAPLLLHPAVSYLEPAAAYW